MLKINRASAGSGKTFDLAHEYIRLLLGHTDETTGKFTLANERSRHRNILGVTFTNKATEEMKRRIIHELAVIAGLEKGWPKPSPYLKYLTKELGCTSDQLRDAANRALTDILTDYNGFQISTIDSFFQGVLRAFAREAELSGNYEIELDRLSQIHVAVDHMLSSLRDPSDPAANARLEEWLLDLMKENMQNGQAFNIFNRSTKLFKDIVEFIDGISDETFMARRDEILNDIASGSGSKLALFKEAIYNWKKNYRKSISDTVEQILRKVEGYGEPEKVLSTYSYKLLLKWQGTEWIDSSKSKTLGEILVDPQSAIRKHSKGKLKGTPILNLEADTALGEMLLSYAQMVNDSKPLLDMVSDINKGIYRVGLVERAYQFLTDDLIDSNKLLLADTNSILSGIIADGSSPFVYERIGNRIEHFLMDEFQDTSRMQWEIMRPLLNEGLAAGNDSLIIGDEKQCIYRFRNSDPELLHSQVTTDMGSFVGADSAKMTDEEGHPKRDTNWRSSPVVVDFNNNLFSKLATAFGFEDVYSNVEQLWPKDNENKPGYVAVDFIPYNIKKDESADDAAAESAEKWLSTEDYPTSRRTSPPNLCKMMDEIARQLKAGYKPSDIVVLVRKGSDGAKVIDYLLRAHEIDEAWPTLRVVSDDAMYIGNSPAVNLVISTLRRLATSSAEPALARALSTKSVKRKRHELALMEHEFDSALNNGESRSAALEKAVEARDEDIRRGRRSAATAAADPSMAIGQPDDTDADIRREILDRVVCADLLSVTEAVIGMIRTDKICRDENIYLSALQDIVINFTRSNNNDLREFLQWWDIKGKKSAVELPPDDNAIRVMTIHKSKGLEFPCVHIPFASWELYNEKKAKPVWMDITGLTDIMGIPVESIPALFPLKPNKWMADTFLADTYNAIYDGACLDELNVAYVAFTRAVNELNIIFDSDPGKTTKDNNIGEDAAPILGLSAKENHVEFGKPTTPVAAEKKPKKVLDADGSFEILPYEAAVRADIWRHTKLTPDDDSTPVAAVN